MREFLDRTAFSMINPHSHISHILRYLLFFGAILFSIAFSLHWIIPLFEAWKAGSVDIFTPLFNNAISDSYFYFAKIRDVIDGLFFSYDPLIYEHRYTPNPHITYIGSYWIAGVSGLFTDSSYIAYYCCHLLFPFLTFYITGRILLAFFPDRPETLPLTALISLAGMFWIPVGLFVHIPNRIKGILNFLLLNNIDVTDYRMLSELYRLPNTMIMAPLCLITCYLLIVPLSKQHSSFKRPFSTGILLGITFLTGTSNLIFLCGFIAFFYILHFKDLQYRRYLESAFAIALPFLLYGIYLAAIGTANLSETDTISFTPPENPLKTPHLLLLEVACLFIPLSISFIFRPPYRNIAISAFASACIGYIAVYYAAGNFYAARIIARSGADCFLGVSISFWLLDLATPKRSRSFLIERTINSLSLVSFFSILFLLVLNQFLVWTKSPEQSYRKDYTTLCSWLRNNTNDNDVLLTFDPELIINLPSCAPTSHYIPQAFLSSAPEAERMQRFFEVAHFLEVTPLEIKNLLVNKLGPQDFITSNDRREVALSLWQLILFYGKHYYYGRGDGMLPEAEWSNLEYKYLHSPNNILSYKHDLVIISNQPYYPSGTPPLQAKLLFSNDTYSVYNTPNNS